MRKLIDWLMDGGGYFIGRDADGERMYSISNGQYVAFWIVITCLTAIVLLIAKGLIMATVRYYF